MTFGIGGMFVNFGEVSLKGISLCAIVAIFVELNFAESTKNRKLIAKSSKQAVWCLQAVFFFILITNFLPAILGICLQYQYILPIYEFDPETFDNFDADSNRLLCNSLFENFAHLQQNFFYIWGAKSSGKTLTC